MPKLQVLLPDAPEISHDLSEDTTTIGRVDDNLLQITDDSVSSHHAEIRRKGNDYVIVDLDSTNGTRINGETITQKTLRPGDRVRFGNVEAIFQADGPAGTQQPLPEEDAPAAVPAEQSARPADFSNASPFTKKKKPKDKTGQLVMALAILSFVVFAAAVASIVLLPAPTL
jgi:pSer/pThr/pTyr-binding forkhead associated (FHA) protein